MFGAIPTPLSKVVDDLAIRPLSKLLVGGPARRQKVDWSDWLDFVPDQGNTSSCVANAMSSACYLAGQAQKRPIKRPSRRHLYDLARYRMTPGVLNDDGSRTDLMCEAAVMHGIIAEDRFPFEPDAINEPPPFDTDIAGADALGLDWWRAADDPEELAVALDRGQFPVICMPVHQNFVDWTSSEPYFEVAGGLLGNHALCVVGFEDDPTQGLIFEVLNSWSPGWCQGGFIRIRGDFVRRKVFDRILLRSAPAPR